MSPTIFLQFESEAAAHQAMVFWRDENGWHTGAGVEAIDEIGTIRTPAEYDADGELISGGEALPGWHVNIAALECPADLQAYQITPATPERVFA